MSKVEKWVIFEFYLVLLNISLVLLFTAKQTIMNENMEKKKFNVQTVKKNNEILKIWRKEN